MVIRDYGFFFKHSCTYHMLLCTLCIDEHLCRSADRPIGQKEDHACLWPACCTLHHSCVCLVSHKSSDGMALICPEHHFRANEHGTAASFRSCYDTDYSRTVLSKNKCTSFSIPVIDLHIKSLDCYRLVRFCRTEWRRGSRCRKLYNCIYGAAVFCFTSKEQEREKRKRLSSCKRRSGILETQSYDFDAAVVFVGHQFCIFCFWRRTAGICSPKSKGQPGRSWHRHFLLRCSYDCWQSNCFCPA